VFVPVASGVVGDKRSVPNHRLRARGIAALRAGYLPAAAHAGRCLP
jgi:hypothetical protein